jgi:protein ImuB
MSFVCLSTPDWPAAQASKTDRAAVLAKLLTSAPRIMAGEGIVWADASGLSGRDVALNAAEILSAQDVIVPRVGIAHSAISAELAARYETRPTVLMSAGSRVPDDAASKREPHIVDVPRGADREFLATYSVSVLKPDPAVMNLFDAVGIEYCGDLAKLDQESVEVRFGAEGVRLWKLSRGEDDRLVFGASSKTLPQASLQWPDYSIRFAERLLFVINELARNVCDALHARGDGAREMTLAFSLENRTTYEHLLRPARATANQKAWMRLIRTELERIKLREGVVGLELRVESVAPTGGVQGDIFDRGFSTAQAAEETIGQLLDDQGAVVLKPVVSSHPLVERRTVWASQEPSEVVRTRVAGAVEDQPAVQLTLHLEPELRRVHVETVERRDHVVPVRYREVVGSASWMDIVDVAGPDIVSGHTWGEMFDREYYRCVVRDGAMVWLFRDRRQGRWYVQGWWD